MSAAKGGRGGLANADKEGWWGQPNVDKQVQKSAFRLILGSQYLSYKNALDVLKMESLKDRRETLFQKFAIKSLEVQQTKTILKENKNTHIMETRKKIQNY